MGCLGIRSSSVYLLAESFSYYYINPVICLNRKMTLHEEAYADSIGSCCDDGRFVFQPCDNFWYYCHEWGLLNYSSCWMQHGAGSFTFPCGTAHQARCEYFSERTLCPSPSSCASAVVTSSTSPVVADIISPSVSDLIQKQEYCPEIAKVEHWIK